MSAAVENEYTVVEITARREPHWRSRTEAFEIHARDIGLTIGVAVVWEDAVHRFRPGTAHRDKAVALVKRVLCEALDEAVADDGGMSVAVFDAVFRAACDREGFLPWDGGDIETGDEIGFG